VVHPLKVIKANTTKVHARRRSSILKPYRRGGTGVEESYRFGGMDFSPGRRSLQVDGRAVRLGGRAFDLLEMLVRNADRVVTQAELDDALWPGMAVGPNNLQVHICTLRRLIGPAAIATVARRGYRLMLDVQVARDASQAAANPARDALLGLVRRSRLVSLVGADAQARRVAAHEVAQAFRAAQAPWLLEPNAIQAGASGAAARLWRELGAGGGLVVLHDAHLAHDLATFSDRVMQTHHGARLVLTAQTALGLRGEVAWALPAPPPAAAGSASLRWLDRAA
jgi:DNA-binding winged helix-turn-helix (wHTH) protein